MIGASRTSIAALREAVNARFDSADEAALASDGQSVLSFASLLGRERTLRQTLSDSALDTAAKNALLQRLLGDKMAQSALELIGVAVTQRWSTDADMVDALDETGQNLLLMSAEKQGRLDRVEEEVFRFGRIIDSNPDLQMALTNPAVGEDAKASITGQLLDGKADEITVRLLQSVTTELHGRPVQVAVAGLSTLAAARRGRVVAEVRSARELSDEQKRRLVEALGRLHNRDVQLNVTVDPSIVGGLEVRVGDEVIDGTLSTRIEAARRRLTH
ncbi:MAG: F0F1 ATP synthase subunit delta [Candidatus Nanopelagicales bacterium]|jgi:F-type H+-transporting ATPase subunit delta|nr:F0F1 ATP synthase subunit delta [Candidatus Nanopelagicales bacterium]MCU0297654.1 F0F1 ATP synthase subunit delta [Candidatus Nanopelagicales bacterium]